LHQSVFSTEVLDSLSDSYLQVAKTEQTLATKLVPLLLSTHKVGYQKKGKGAALIIHSGEVLKTNPLPDVTDRMQPAVGIMEIMEVD
jgi:hypothetical protein